jgi:hypothetical protein
VWTTKTTKKYLVGQVLPLAPYSPDLTPTDFHLFGPLKDIITQMKKTMQNAVSQW